MRKSEQQLAAIFSAAAAGLSQLSLGGSFERVNDALCEMLGRSRDELIGKPALSVTHPDDVVPSLRAMAQALQTRTAVSLDKRYLRADGHVVWANSRLTRLDDEAGEPRGVLAVTIDLTARHEAERALRESEAKFRTLADASPAVIWFMGPEGETRFVNRAFREFTGVTDGEVIRLGWRTLLHPEDAPDYVRGLLRASHERQPFHGRTRIRRWDGEWRTIESQSLPHFDQEGCYMGQVGHSLDVTERMVAIEALRHSEERLRRATQIDTVGIAFFKLSGPVSEANGAYLRMSGFSLEDVRAGRLSWKAITPEAWSEATQDALAELHAAGRITPYEKECQRKDGTRWWGLFSASRLSPDEAVEFVVDITVRKQAEATLLEYRTELEHRVRLRTAELDEANQALRVEIATRKRAEHARHELWQQLVKAQEDERRRLSRELHDQVGQELTGLILGLRALEASGISGEHLERLHGLQALTEKIGKQLHDLAFEIRPTALDDLGLLSTVTHLLEDWSKRTGIEVAFHTAGTTSERMPAATEATIYRVLREALTNVLKHAGASRVSVIIERQAEQVVTIIEDNGRGFDVDHVHAPSRPQRLGIRSMQERAALAGGELKIESTSGHGTTVFLRLPVPLALESTHE